MLAVALTFAALAAADCRRVSGSGATSSAPAPAAANDRRHPPDGARPAATAAPAPPSPRWRATEGVSSGTVMRVQGVAEATPGARLAGYLIRAGTERPAEAEHIRELVALLRSDAGFDDTVVKRCRPGTSVGFRLKRTDGGGASPAATELVLDFGCGRLIIGQAGTTAAIHATYFDPSRGAFVSLAKRILPRDPEIGRLK